MPWRIGLQFELVEQTERLPKSGAAASRSRNGDHSAMASLFPRLQALRHQRNPLPDDANA